MGRNKLLLQLAGEPLVRRACRRALAAGLHPLVVVLGYESERVRAALAGLDCCFAYNPELEGPMSGSLHRGLEALPADAEGAVIMLADMVNVTESMLRTVALAAQTAHGAGGIIALRADACAARTTSGVRSSASSIAYNAVKAAARWSWSDQREHALYVDWPLGALMDVDTPEEYATL
jgi:molybdenum cofactor cytidylyltransferase